jgi:SAM-dependent methyltransferase
MPINFWQYLQVGKEQWLAQPDLLRKAFVRLFGPLGVHARIRNTRVINAISRMNLPADARVLDAGCGHAYATFWLARRHPQIQFDALEIDEKLVRNGQIISRGLGLQNVRFILGTALEVADDGTYDLLFSIDVLEHIVDDVGTLGKFHRAIKPAGTLLLHLPRRHQEHKRFISSFSRHTTPDHVRDEYTAAEIREKLAQTGFEVMSINYGFSMWGELAFESNYLFWKWPPLRILSALVLHPLSVWLAYMDTRQDYDDGNSLLILARPQNAGDPAVPPAQSIS